MARNAELGMEAGTTLLCHCCFLSPEQDSGNNPQRSLGIWGSGSSQGGLGAGSWSRARSTSFSCSCGLGGAGAQAPGRERHHNEKRQPASVLQGGLSHPFVSQIALVPRGRKGWKKRKEGIREKGKEGGGEGRNGLFLACVWRDWP